MWMWFAAGVTFLVSLPVMWSIGQTAIFLLGYVFWAVPWFLGGMLGGALFPQGSYSFARTEFDGPIIGFAFVAALQNALMIWLVLRGARWASRYGRDADDET